MPKSTAVILLNWNTPEHTTQCINSLKQHCDETLFDIIVADNGSTDNSIATLKKAFPDAIFIDNKENLGFAEGNNRALTYSLTNGYTYSLLLNTDTLVDEDILTKLTAHLNKYRNAAAVQPAIYWMHNKAAIWNGEGSFKKISGSVTSATNVPNANQTFSRVDWVTGCCMLLRNDALLKSGLFNKLFFLYYEDVDLSLRLREAGFELHYLPSSKMYHEAGVSAKVSAPKKEGFLSPVIHYYTSRNRIWILRRYGNALFFPVYAIRFGLYYAAVLAYFKIRGRGQKATQLIKGIKEGISTPKRLIWPDKYL
ncbi:glycosyltransferase family 2 protein [Mucilaginibacter glaciei]|uniref:Glycosyltransferase family 2 protein n=1 Tax=Mucilaginibacter glaciei TaxID=2772109 RepID=A0A926S0S5_9SPHI|nr:glycosyltransferase family 2 protein [Mucilaginibacter glaciei]MBD1392303.1 glycosyltransferase family 2 protein [Mucilaginibacter glaciei]